ncbi:MAG: serine/threonine protein kinase, partial [Phycisphaerae bacterium]
MQECPEATSFRRYMRGGLPEDSVDRFERHIQECGSCLSRLIALGQVDSAPTVPQCHIVGQLGSGRFGVVYKAWWLGDTPRLVALKCLSYSGEIERERFDREIKVLRQIDSPHIVKCLASGITGGTHYFVMDLIRGEHLDEYVANRATDLDHKLAIFQRVCLAVAEAHAKGVIHRDLKPRNILVDAAGEPHILDFGICALEAEDWSSSACHTITRFGDIIGTLKYMSPEQAWGGVSGPIDERSDIWALGIMLHEIVTDGGYPYSLTATAERPAHEALLERIRKEMPTLPRLGFVDRGRQLEILLERCLSWEPEKRLNSAQQLAEDIGRYRARQRITTKPFSAPHRIHRLAIGVAARSRWAIQLALVATVAVVLWAAAYFFDIRWGVDGAVHAGRASAAWTAPPSFGGSAARMVIAGVSDSTASSVVAFARAKGIPGVNHEVTSWRAVHGCLMRRLAGVKPAVVVWDYFFEVPRPGDAGFVAGLEALDEAGVPVVLAARTYRADGTPKLSETLTTMPRRRVRHGSIFARDMVDREGQFV